MDPALYRKCQHQMAWETQRSSDYKFSSEPVTLLTYTDLYRVLILVDSYRVNNKQQMWAGHKRGHCHIFLSQFFKLCLPLATASKRGGQTVHPVKPGLSRRPVTKTLSSAERNLGGFVISIEVKMSEDINCGKGCFFLFTDIGNKRGLQRSPSKTGANPRPVTTKRLPTHDKLSNQEGRFYYFG